MESYIYTDRADIKARTNLVRSYRPEQNARLTIMVGQIKQRYVYEFESLESIRCHFIFYTAMILFELWRFERLKQSIAVGTHPRMTIIQYQQYRFRVKFLVDQLKQTLRCELRMRSFCRTAWRKVHFWEHKRLYTLQNWKAAAAAHLGNARGQLSCCPPISDNAEEEFEIAQDMADKEDCGEYLARRGRKTEKDLTVEQLSERSRFKKYIISRRMRDRWCQDEWLWFDGKCQQRIPRTSHIRGKKWWDERMQSAD